MTRNILTYNTDLFWEYAQRSIDLITKGQFEEAQEILQPSEKFGHLSQLAESLSMLGVKLEAREFTLNEKIRELKQIRKKLQNENRTLKKELSSSHGIFSLRSSISLKGMMEIIEKVAPTEATVLITGESGTGKEVVANNIHHLSERRDNRFVALNCAALPESLLEVELFGIEKGVATGVTDRPGKFEMAHNGTLFLDEIGDMSMTIQAKVLRAIQEREIARVGSSTTKKVDIRIIAATNKNLEEAIRQGFFREDLYFRLNVITVELPSLRDRADDILPLAHFFSRRFADHYNRDIQGFSQDAEKCLLDHKWPGNIRELKNTMERAVLINTGAVIQSEALSLKNPGFSTISQSVEDTISLRHQRNIDEKRVILDTLSKFNGNRNETSRELGIHRETLRLKMKKYGIVWRKQRRT